MAKKAHTKLDGLVSRFEALHRDYPQAGFNQTLVKLDQQRTELACQIGRKVHP